MAFIVNVVVTREVGKNESLTSWLPPESTVVEVPLTTTRYFDLDAVRAALDSSPSNGRFRSLVVTSERSADYLATALRASATDVEVFSVGPTTTTAFITRNLDVHAQAEGPSVSLAPRITRGPVLLLGAASMREELGAALREKGLAVELISCYETVGRKLDPAEIESLRDADVVFIGAPSAWAVAREFVRTAAWVVVPGASTGAVVRDDHPRVLEGWGPDLRTRLGELS
ncbi:MAG TPA: uroporphyrinogen-III synthase [Acidimicrobiales bacterium]|nr:uroporphyrinogen-III synthase [Acidimicrobiales bacterium]